MQIFREFFIKKMRWKKLFSLIFTFVTKGMVTKEKKKVVSRQPNLFI